MHIYIRYNKTAMDLSSLSDLLTRHIPNLTLELVDIRDSEIHYFNICDVGLPPHCVTINVIDSFDAFTKTRSTILGNYEDVYVPFTSLPLRDAQNEYTGGLHKNISQELLLSMIAAPILKLTFMRWDTYGPC